MGSGGLVPAVVQDVADGRVLMVAWVDAEALAATLATGEVHFHSRSRGRLWRKGETSGNVLRLRSLALDCDGDALLLGVEPAGPTCHRGTRSCFDADDTCRRELRPQPRGSRGSRRCGRRSRIAPRRVPAGSYTAALLDGGVDVAGPQGDRGGDRGPAGGQGRRGRRGRGRAIEPRPRALLAGEAADLVYHTLVLLAERGLEPRGRDRRPPRRHAAAEAALASSDARTDRALRACRPGTSSQLPAIEARERARRRR